MFTMDSEKKNKVQNVLLVLLLLITVIAAGVALYFAFYRQTRIGNF